MRFCTNWTFLHLIPLLAFLPSSVSGQCEPVCAQGCVNGTCVSPGVCQCHFGFVGDNCSSQCSCNKHSNCAGVNKPDVCLECHNNTIVRLLGKRHANTLNTVFPCTTLTISRFAISRVSTARSASLCLWALPKGAAFVVHVASFAGETVACVCRGTNTGRPWRVLSSSCWTPAE